MGSFHRCPKLLQIFRIGRGKDRAPGLDVMNIKFLCYMRGKVLEFHLLGSRNSAGSLSVPSLPAHDEFAKRVGCYRDPVSRSGRELNRRFRSSSGGRKRGEKPCSRRNAGALSKK